MMWLGLGLPSWYFALGIFHMALAQGVATLACRAAGVSQEGLRYEVIERDARAALAPYISPAPEFEVKELWMRQVKVDPGGIEARHSDGKWKRVEWREVETCTFTALRNAVGNYIAPSLTLQGSEELPLLQSTPATRDVEKLLEAIRFYLRAEEPPHADVVASVR
jgi:hypothetical protein